MNSVADTSSGWTARGPEDGQRVILLHGWSCSKKQWAYLLPALTRRFRTFTMDLPGHGTSPFQPPLTQPTICDLSGIVAELIVEAVPTGPVALVGHSLGSAVALEVAARLGTRVHSLISLDGLVYTDVYERQDEDEIARFLAPLVDDYATAAPTYLESLVLAHDRLPWRRLSPTCSCLHPEFGIELYRSLLRWDMTAALRATTVPVTVLCASATYKPEICSHHVPRLTIVPIAGTGHYPHMEAPEVVAPLIEGLLDAPASPAEPSTVGACS